jgi:hypothetical protein
MNRRGYKVVVSFFYSSFPPIPGGQELAPDILRGCKTGCYGVIGPVPSTVLDKRKNCKRTRVAFTSNIQKRVYLSRGAQ